mgnify:FL=1|tara:strand:+ start:1536 stop:1859 length:324 start_codon:yes stop_codon:yes gene_type:complete
MRKFIYIANAADDATSYPVDSIRNIDTAAGKLHIYMTPARITSVLATDATDLITLSVGADEKAAAKSVVKAICDPYGDKFLVLADDENSVYLTGSGITAVDSITYAV